MKNRDIAIVMFSIAFGIACLLYGVLWMVMAKDLKEQLIKVEEEVIQLRWENENNYMYCEVE